MPHGDEQGSTDEVKVFKHEEDDEDNLGAEDLNVEDGLTEDKSSLITESETKATDAGSNRENEGGSAFGPLGGRPYEPLAERHPFSYPYSLYSSYSGSLSMVSTVVSDANAADAGMVSRKPGQPGKVPLHPPGISPFFYSGDSLSQPPPAHMGIPSYPLDPKPGMARAPVYPFTPVSSHCAYPPLGAPDLPPWNSPALYPSTSGAFRSAYSGLPSSLHRFSPGLLPHSLPPHLLHPEYLKHNGDNRHNADVKPVISAPPPGSGSKQQQNNGQEPEKKKCHIKKPLNAFMLYMKEMRAKVVAECTLKESAAINQILGRR
ncbi:protein pangolin, isoforms A/H/I/S-like, partial [Amphibalanus amphitrite]|uniref:protein pangolin, isoforms A/H/I/S-like n=1 Tax=Amphibalanus amphitrite TaxID=1232801 RepID=UPI001C903C51